MAETPDSNSSDDIRNELEKALTTKHGPTVARFAIACISGLIPYAGGVVGAAGGAWSEAESDHFKRVLHAWIKLQEDEMREIGITLAEVMSRLDLNDLIVLERIESLPYLSLIKKAFRDWSAAESEEKRQLIRNLLVNAASTKMTEDDIVRLFIEWIGKYSETHFKVIRDVYKNPGATRGETWQRLNGRQVREDSAEADLFKLLVHDLSVGRIIRQHRETDYNGNFVKKRAALRKSGTSTMTSAFDDEKSYALTELGRKFVHYTMTEATTKLGSSEA